jgi:hypothetical protein
MTARQAGGAVAGFVLGALLLWLLLRGATVSRWLDALAAVPPLLWVVATLGLLASYALRALRLFVEWQPQVRGLRFADCLRLMLLHNAAVNVVPMRAGEAGYAWIVHRQWGVPLADAVASLLWLRLQDVTILAAFAIAWLLPLPTGTGTALAIAWLAAYALASPRLGSLLSLVPWRPLQRVGTYARRPGQQPWRRPASLACALANWSVKLVVLGVLLAALADVTVTDALRGSLGGELAAVLPVQGPAGLGTYEAGVWGGVALRAQTTSLAHVGAAALAVHLLGLVVGLVAALVAQLATRSWPPTARTVHPQ